MKVQSTRTSVSQGLRHTAAFYSGPFDLFQQLIPLVRAGLERGEPVAVSVRPSTEDALYDRLGNQPGLILLDRPDGPDGGSGQTVATRRARHLRELTTTAGPTTVLTEHSSSLDGVDGSFWTELDAAANVALADLPVNLTCFFPEMPLHLEIVDGARRNHPTLLVGGEVTHNPGHWSPQDVLRERPAPAPVILGPPDLRLTFGAWQLNEVRAMVERALMVAGYGRDRAEDIVLAVNEVATNAVEHGGGEAQLYLWVAGDGTGGDGLVCEVHDGGALNDPLPGLRAPHPSDPRGRGVWIARQLCDSLHIWADARGTHVRLRAGA
ncbi:MAG: sensor histidine kinase [Pseudonocardia sp.]|nr:sensor histidine kinase [Pseudonocardia sp.]